MITLIMCLKFIQYVLILTMVEILNSCDKPFSPNTTDSIKIVILNIMNNEGVLKFVKRPENVIISCTITNFLSLN